MEQNDGLRFLLIVWGIVTFCYLLAIITLVSINNFFIIDILTVPLFVILRFPVPVTLLYNVPASLFQSAGSAPIVQGPYFWILVVINIVGVIMSYIGIQNVRNNWGWGFAFIVLALLSFGLAYANFIQGTCNIDGGTGGLIIDNCAYGATSAAIAGFVSSAVLLVVAIGITKLAHDKA